MYKNLTIDRELTFWGSKVQGCYIVINTVSISDVKNLTAYYKLLVYQSKAKYLVNINDVVKIDEIPTEIVLQFSADFNQGDLFQKISEELKNKLLSINPNFDESDIAIEQ